MKTILILILLTRITFCSAQYSRDKLMNILTGGNVKSWMVKATNDAQLDRSYTFNKEMTAKTEKTTGKTLANKWALTTPDNIRWFLVLGKQKFEIIVSYDKTGKQYLKLTHQPDDSKTSVYYETIIYPSK